MTRWSAIVLFGCAALVTAWIFRSSEKDGSARSAEVLVTTTAGEAEPAGGVPEDRHVKASAPSVNGGPAARRFRVPDSFLPSPFATTTRVNGPHKMMALTQDDKVWLDRNGFPTLTEVEWSKQAPIDELKDAAQYSLAMAALYGDRLWEEGHYKEGKRIIWEAVVGGSVYAAEAMAYRILKDGTVWPDGTNAAAFEAAGWWLYASQRGDYYVSEDIGNFLSASKGLDFGWGLRRALEIGLEVDAARVKLGLSPATRDARPSYKEYVEGKSQQEVTVIPR